MDCAEYMSGVKMPEVLSGLEVDWRGYEPPGGYEWQKFFMDAYAGLSEMVAGFCAHRADVVAANERAKEILRHTGDVDSFVSMVSELVPNDSADPLALWTALAPAAIEAVKRRLAEKVACDGTLKEIDEDIAFASALERLFVVDAELDMVLFAIHKVPMKFRIKLFRHAFRLSRVVDDAFAVIRRSRTPIKGRVLALFKEPYEGLAKAYATLLPVLKMAKKRVDRDGSRFLEDEWQADVGRIRVEQWAPVAWRAVQ